MIYPKSKAENSDIDLKLGIKSSLPYATKAIALAYLIWDGSFESSSVAYSNQVGDMIVMNQQVYARIKDSMEEYVENFEETFFDKSVSENPLFKAQIEALIVGFELVWKLARFQFVDKLFPFSAERTGGKRYEKIIFYTSNIDVLGLLVKSQKKEYFQLFYEILTDKEISNKNVFDSFRKLLTIFSETAIYKIEHEGNDLIFDNLGIYKSLLENDNVSLSDDKENKGASRILKSSVNEGLNYFLTFSNGTVSKNQNSNLAEYSLRVENFLSLMNIKITYSDKNKIEPEVSSSPITSPFSPTQTIFYGVPGSGKSHKIDEETKDLPDEQKMRVVFHPEYTNADFVGQILPNNTDGTISYKFKPGPFTKILRRAYLNPSKKYCLIIEEINRGNAAAIFGDVFQLLDRITDGKGEASGGYSYGNGWSRYSIENEFMNWYIRENLYADTNHKLQNEDDGIAEKSDELQKSIEIGNLHFSALTGIRLPPNLSLFATMNTSDQNVFTLDNAFQRRWDMKLVENKFEGKDAEKQRNAKIGGTEVTWEIFQTFINKKISESSSSVGMSSMEDKRLGCWFVKETDGKISKEKFAEKVLKYLWDDAFKFNHDDIFNIQENASFESIVEKFKGKENESCDWSIFKDTSFVQSANEQ